MDILIDTASHDESTILVTTNKTTLLSYVALYINIYIIIWLESNWYHIATNKYDTAKWYSN